MNKRILARTLLAYSTDQLREILTGDFDLVFDDGTVSTNARETIYSSYVWEFHKRYDKTPMLMKHHVRAVLGNKRLGTGTFLDLTGNAMWSTYDAYFDNTTAGQAGVLFRDELSELLYSITSSTYSDIIQHVDEHVTSLDITDLIEIIEHDDVRVLLSTPEPTQEYVVSAYDALKTLLSGDKLSHNPVVKANKSGLVNLNQLLQCLGPRGYVTDIDSVRFNTPITRSFTQGFKDFYSSLIESRSASKSLFQNKSMLENAEYFSRKVQLLCMGVERLHPGDCGSQHYLLWNVAPPIFEGSKKTYDGDLKYLEGKYYWNKAENRLDVISKNDTHLFGQTLQLRSVIGGCMHPDPHGLCSVCFGRLSDSVPANTNIGHYCAVTMTEKSTQSVLSTKHLDANVIIAVISLAMEYYNFLLVGPDGNSYHVNPKLKGKEVKLYISQQELPGITDITTVENVSKLSVTRISGISGIGISTMHKGTFDSINIPVVVEKRLASLTYEMLQYIRDFGYSMSEDSTINKDSTVVIDLHAWDFSKPIMSLPLKQYNMGDHSESISRLVEQSDISSTPEARLGDLFTLVTSKLDVNLAVLELIIYAGTCISNEDENYALPKPWTTNETGSYATLITHRSLSAAMAYEEQHITVGDPSSFSRIDRMSHPMDVFIMPEEAMRDN